MNPTVEFEQRLGRGKPSGEYGEYRYRCPICQYKDPTLAVNYVTGKFICFWAGCGVKGHLSYLARRLGFAYDVEPLISSLDQLRFRLWNFGEEKKSAKSFEPIKIPRGLRQIVPGTFAWDYLTNRGISEAEIYINELSIAEEDYGRRIYFLQRDEAQRIIYWVGRKYLPGTPGPKYSNPGGSIKKNLLFRSHLIDRTRPVSVCEGPISAIVAGNAVATLGVLFSKEQVRAIASLGCPILCAFDGEAFSRSIELAKALDFYNVAAKVVPLPFGLDPADLGRLWYDYFVSIAFTWEPGTLQHLRERLNRTDTIIRSTYLPLPGSVSNLRERLSQLW